MPTSLRGKLIIIFIALTVGAMAISTGYARYMQKHFILKRAHEHAAADLKLIGSEIQTVLQWVIRDIFFLSDLPQLHDFLGAQDHANKAKALLSVKRAFLALAGHHRIYHQIRFLDESGTEIVRVDFDGLRTTLIPVSQLQQKGGRYYFKNAILLQGGQIYISPMDLNVEHGVIERPFVPTIRYATPIIDRQGHKRGIIVMNVLGNSLLQVLERQQQQRQLHNVTYYLLNDHGDFLFHPDHAKIFGFMLGTGEKLSRYEPGIMTWIADADKGVRVQKSASTGKKTLFAFQKIPLWTGPLDHFSFNLETTRRTASPDTHNIAPHKTHWTLMSAMDEDKFIVGLDEYSTSFFIFTAIFAHCLHPGCHGCRSWRLQTGGLFGRSRKKYSKRRPDLPGADLFQR